MKVDNIILSAQYFALMKFYLKLQLSAKRIFSLLLIFLDIGGKGGKEEDEAQKIYREIIEVVSSASPASLQAVRGRMVGYGEEAGATLRRAAKGRQERPGDNRGPQGARHR